MTVDVGNNNNVHFSACTCNGESPQIWHLAEMDNNGYSLIISKFNNLCLFAHYATADDNIYTTECNGNNEAQRWKITSEGIINGAERAGYQNCLDADRAASNDQNQQIIFNPESIIKDIY